VSKERRITKGKTIGVALVMAIVSISIPASAAAEGNVVDDLLKGVNDVVGGATGGGGGGGPAANGQDAPRDRAGSPPSYTPPLHGSNPHGQGTAAVVDLAPSNNLPLGGNPDGSDAGPEEVVLGRTRGEQDAAGNYNGHITILALLGQEIVGVDTDEGETANSPFAGLQGGLDQICDPNGPMCAITLLKADSATTNTGSTNVFKAADVRLGTGASSIRAGAAGSNGNISESGGCQTAHGDSSVADASVGEDPATPVAEGLSISAADSRSDSTACSSGFQSQQNESRVILINGEAVGFPDEACVDDTQPTSAIALLPFLAAVCHADDSNGSQTSAPYGVREALSVFAAISAMGDPAVKTTLAASESHVVPPARAVPPAAVPPGPAGPRGPRGPRGPGDGPDGPGGPVTTAAQPGDGVLAFTGSELTTLALIGAMLIGSGLMVAGVAGRGRKATV